MDPIEVQNTPDTPKKSHRLWWVVGGAVLLLLIAGAIVYALVMNGTKPEETANNTSPAPSAEVSVPTKDEAKQNIATLDASIKQASTDQSAAKTALKDKEKQIKVGN